MKKLAAALLVATSLNAAAANGPLDGIHECSVGVSGQNFGLYVTVNGMPDGTTIFTLPAISAQPLAYGYGIGKIQNGQFQGTTSENVPFTLNISGTTISGTVPIQTSLGLLDVTINCHLFF